MATKPSDCQIILQKKHIQSKTSTLKKDQIDYFSTYYVTST